MSGAVETIDAPASPLRRSVRTRRRVLLVFGILLGVSVLILAFLLAVDAWSNGEVSVLVGPFGSEPMSGLALVVALVCLAAGLCLIPVPRRWLVLLVPARLVAIGAAGLAVFVWGITGMPSVTPLANDGCETGYVVEERSFLLAGFGTVYRQDGIFYTRMATTSGDDGYQPFHDNAYAVTDDGTSLHVWYIVKSVSEPEPVSTAGEPAFTLPKVTGRGFTCGLARPAAVQGAPAPTPAVPVPPTIVESQQSIQEMAAMSLDAAVGVVKDGNGQAFDLAAVPAMSAACDETGARVTLTLAFQTADNSASLGRILAAWDKAGYLPDRAIQEDIRYSDTRPVETMSIRDKTTIDGLIHMQITSRCSTTAHDSS